VETARSQPKQEKELGESQHRRETFRPDDGEGKDGKLAPSRALEEVIALTRDDEPDGEGKILAVLHKGPVYVLGQPAGEVVGRHGSESDLLHFTIDDAQGVDRVMLPAFTNPAIMKAALLRNPEWQTLSVLQIDGRALWENIDKNVILVINPWSRLEFQLPRSSLANAPKVESEAHGLASRSKPSNRRRRQR